LASAFMFWRKALGLGDLTSGMVISSQFWQIA
jgi:hypothetical protein